MAALPVAVGVILNAQHHILLTRRAAATHQGGLWEFPGGKLEHGESPAQALARELREELAIDIVRSTPLLQVHHDYADKSVVLHVSVVWAFTGVAQPMEAQPMAWVSAQALNDYALPPANTPIVHAVQQLLVPRNA